MLKRIRNISPSDFRRIAVVLTFSVAVVSLIPLDKHVLPPGHSDKLIHALLYFVLFVVWHKALPGFSRKVFWGLFVMGVSIEIAQQLLPVNRSMDVFDMAANTVGLLAGYYLLYQKPD